MGNPRGFLQIGRQKGSARPVTERLTDWREFESLPATSTVRQQASRCMDCGIPFCHQGCPLGNLIPDWNDLVYRGRDGEAREALAATNNFPEITGRVCPAPCEAACVLNLDGAPVTIKDIERQLGDQELEAGLRPRPRAPSTGRRVAVVGSGPAGMAAAQELVRKGHAVTLYERSDRLGGLLRYGIPDFKLDKSVLDRRFAQLAAEGVEFRTGVEIGVTIPAQEIRRQHDAIVLCVGASVPRALTVPGADARGVVWAMDFLEQQNRRVAGDTHDPDKAIVATGKHVVILGGGDTGSDCLGTSLRQGAASVSQLELMPRPPEQRHAHNPWPEWPLVLRTSSSQEEGGRRDFAVHTRRVLTDEAGHVRALEVVRLERVEGELREIAGSEFELPCDLLLLAMGYTGVEPRPWLAELGLELGTRGTLQTHPASDVFAAGDAVRGASLVVWAIAEGRRVAQLVHESLSQNVAAQ